MIKKILLGLALLIVAFLVLAAFQPDHFNVARSINISAPAAVPFAQINDLHKWQEMSPYVKMDPAAKYTWIGPAAGVGAGMHWAGNNEVGEGTMTITESRPNELIRTQLDFSKPFASVCNCEFKFEPAGDQTKVTWSMSGQKNYLSKAMCMVMNMDKMVGTQFEEGLANLKRLAEAQPAAGGSSQ